MLKYYNNLNFLLYSLVGPLIELDHIAISGRTLEEASDYIESRLGVKVQDGGCHDRYGTHNKLLGLAGGIYLEAIAVNPAAKNFYRPRWFNLDNFDYEPQITNWICRSKNIKNVVKNLSFESAKIIQIERDGLKWLMAVPINGILPFDGAFPALLQWKNYPPATKLIPSGCSLKHLTISHPDATKLQKKIQIFKDSRVSFETHDQVRFFAEFTTPQGVRSIE